MFWSEIWARVLSVVTMKRPKHLRPQRRDCLLVQPVSTEVQHHTSPSKIPSPQRWRVTGSWKIFVLSSNCSLVVCVFCKILRPTIDLIFGRTRNFKLCKLVKVSYKHSDFCVRSIQNKKNSGYSLLGPALKSAQRRILLEFSAVTHVVKNQIKCTLLAWKSAQSCLNFLPIHDCFLCVWIIL